MASQAQTAANRQNAQSSTGPRTDSGRAASSRNRITLGLFTQSSYVKPEERDFYEELRQATFNDLTPACLLEESFTAEVIAATWRLHRCAVAEAELPSWDDSTEKSRRSIDRARAAAHCVLNRSMNQLRKMQTERVTRQQLALGNKHTDPLAESKQVCQAINLQLRNRRIDPAPAAEPRIDAEAAIAKVMNQTPDWAAVDRALAAEKRNSSLDLASNCNLKPTAVDTARNAPCPCHSGEKFKRCCGRNAPPLLQKAA